MRREHEEAGGVIRVVIVDDHPSYGHGLRMLLGALASGIEVVATATSAAAGREAVRRHGPDVVIADIRMPDGDGIAMAEEILTEAPEIAVVMLSASDDDDDVRRAMEVGVRGFLVKDTGVEELVRAVQVVAAGDVVVSPSVARILVGRTAHDAARLELWEVEMLRLVAAGLDNAGIARRLSVSESTLKRNLRAVARKLGAENRVQAAVAATRLGLI